MADGSPPMVVNYQGRLTKVEDLPDEELLRIAQASGGIIPGAQPPAQPAPLTIQETQQAIQRAQAAPLAVEHASDAEVLRLARAAGGVVPGARPPVAPIIVNYQGKPTPIDDLPEEVLTAPGFADALRASGQLAPTPSAPIPQTPPGPALADGNGGGGGPLGQLGRLILGATTTGVPDFSIIGSRRPQAPAAPATPPPNFEAFRALSVFPPGRTTPAQAAAERAPGSIPGLPDVPPTSEDDARRGITTTWGVRDGRPVVVSRTGPEGEALPVPGEGATLAPSRPDAPGGVPQALFETTGKVAGPTAPGVPAQPPGRPAGTTPDTERLLQAGVEAQRRAIEEAATVGARVEAARAASTEVQAQEARRAQAEQAALASTQRQAGEKAEQDYRLAVEELKTPSGAINPARWWQQADTGTKIAAGIAAFLSGIAGSRNPVDTIIERDIAAQKDALDRLGESRRAQVQAKLSLLGAMRARFGDEQAALAATRAAAYGAAEAEARQMEAKATQGAAKARAGELAGQLQAKQAEAVSELRMRQAQTAGLRAEAEMARAKVAALGQPGGLSPEEQKRVVATPHGTTLALNLEEAKKLNNATRAFYNLSQAADRLIQLREEYGQETMPGPIKDEMQANRNAVLLHYKNMLELGAAFTESEQKMVEAVTGGDPTRIAPGVLAGLKRFRDSLGREYNNMYRVATGREPFAGGVQPGGQ